MSCLAIKEDRREAWTRWWTGIMERFKAPDPDPVNIWAHNNIQFNEPGNTSFFETKGREYIVEPVDSAKDWRIRDVVLVFGSQSGKTSGLMAMVGWTIANRNIRILWVMTGQEMADKFADTRWIPMLKASTTKRLITGRYSVKKSEQKLGGCIVDFSGANSSGNLASFPCDMVVLDETDKFPQVVGREANAVSLAEQRAKNAPNPKRIKTSTPSTEDGLIWQEFLKGDQRRYFMPCPHCGKEVVFGWSKSFNTFPKLGCEAYVFWDPAAKVGKTWNYDEVEASAHFLCPFCNGKIFEHHKPGMLAKGRWQPTNKSAEKSFRSYHLSSLYVTAPECSVGKLAVKFLKEKYSLQGVQGFVNGDLAEPWVAQDDYAAKTEWVVSKDAPLGEGSWARFLTADFQELEPHIWWVCRAWEKTTGNSRLIEHGSCNTWEQLEAIQKRLGVADTAVGIDAGYDPTGVYEECCRHGQVKTRPYDPRYPWKQPRHIVGWHPMKGFGKNQGWYDKNHNPMLWGYGEARMAHKEYGIQIVEFNSQTLKDILKRMRQRKTTEKWEITAEWDTDEYRIHLMSEIKKPHVGFGVTTYTWTKRSNNWPNHLLDCEVMQLALAMKFGALKLMLNQNQKEEQNATE